METDIIVKNVEERKGRDARLAAIEAEGLRVAAELAKANEPIVVPTNDATKTPENAVVPTQDKAPVVEKIEVPQQFKDKEGKLDVEKINKSNEHLAKGIEVNEAELVRLNKELQSKFTKTGQEKKELEAQAHEVVDPVEEKKKLESRNKKLMEELGVDEKTFEKLVELADSVAEKKYRPLKEDFERSRASSIEKRQTSELKSLVEQGHEWIVTEGLGRFDKVFQEKPYITKSPTPYLDAIRFIDDAPVVKRQPDSQARTTQKTVILGGNGAVVIPSSEPAQSRESKLSDLVAKLRTATTRAESEEIRRQMDALA